MVEEEKKVESRKTGTTSGHNHSYGMSDIKTMKDDTGHVHGLPKEGVVTDTAHGHEHTFRPFKKGFVPGKKGVNPFK